MKKKIKKTLALLLAMVCCFATFSVAYATEIPTPQVLEASVVSDSSQPRAILGYAWCNTSGKLGGNFSVSTSAGGLFEAHQISLKFDNFNSGSTIYIQIANSNNVEVYAGSFNGNQYYQNLYAPKISGGGTYTVYYSVMSTSGGSPNGTIEIWVY